MGADLAITRRKGEDEEPDFRISRSIVCFSLVMFNVLALYCMVARVDFVFLSSYTVAAAPITACSSISRRTEAGSCEVQMRPQPQPSPGLIAHRTHLSNLCHRVWSFGGVHGLTCGAVATLQVLVPIVDASESTARQGDGHGIHRD